MVTIIALIFRVCHFYYLLNSLNPFSLIPFLIFHLSSPNLQFSGFFLENSCQSRVKTLKLPIKCWCSDEGIIEKFSKSDPNSYFQYYWCLCVVSQMTMQINNPIMKKSIDSCMLSYSYCHGIYEILVIQLIITSIKLVQWRVFFFNFRILTNEKQKFWQSLLNCTKRKKNTKLYKVWRTKMENFGKFLPNYTNMKRKKVILNLRSLTNKNETLNQSSSKLHQVLRT